MSESKWTKLEEYFDRIRRNEETSFNIVTSHDLSYEDYEDISRRLGTFVWANVGSCGLRSLFVHVEDLLVTSLSKPNEYPLIEFLSSSQCGVTDLKLGCSAPDLSQTFTRQDQSALSALSTNQSVTNLVLTVANNTTSISFGKSIVEAFAVRHLCTLQELGLNFDFLDDESTGELTHDLLSVYFQLCPTSLKKLNLYHMCITVKTCELLFPTTQASTHNRSGAENVKFTGCLFDKETSEFLGKILESENAQQGDDTAGVIEVTFDTNQASFCDHSVPPLLLGCFRVPHNSRIRVVEFTVISDGSSHLPLVAYNLPKSLYMRKLTMLLCGADFSTEQDQRLDDALQNIIPTAFRQVIPYRQRPVSSWMEYVETEACTNLFSTTRT